MNYDVISHIRRLKHAISQRKERKRWENVLHTIHNNAFFHFIDNYTNPGPRGGNLTRFLTGTCHRGFKHIPVPYTNFSKMYTRLYTNLSEICTGLYTNFPKMHTRPYTNCKNCENRYRSLYQNRENRYRSLYQNRENRHPSRWHVPVPKICIVAPPGPRTCPLKVHITK